VSLGKVKERLLEVSAIFDGVPWVQSDWCEGERRRAKLISGRKLTGDLHAGPEVEWPFCAVQGEKSLKGAREGDGSYR